MSQLFLYYDELKSILNELDTLDDRTATVEMVENILKRYENSCGKMRRHSYSDIELYLNRRYQESEKSNSEGGLDSLYGNLDLLLKNAHKVSKPDLVIIAFKLKDHLVLQSSKELQKETVKKHIHELNTIEKLKRQFQLVADRNEENLIKINETNAKNANHFIKIEEAEKTVTALSEKTSANLLDIKGVKGDIVKEAVAITSIILTVMTFFLTNSGILTAIRDNVITGRRNILEVLIYVNASMLIGISTLMLIAASFIHKGAFCIKGEKEAFVRSAQFVMPLIIIGISALILILTVIFI